MPDINGKLTQADKDLIKSWVEKFNPHPTCPICSQKNWSIGDHLLHGQIYRPGGGLTVGGDTYPQFFIVCTTCFYAHQFMAAPLGLTNISKKETKAEPVLEPPVTQDG